MTIRTTKVIALSLFVVLGVFAGTAVKVHANPSYIAPGVATGSTVSSLSYMTPGTATTTTPTYDSYTDGTNNTPNTATLLVQFTASSTASILNISLEYSNDGTNWYRDLLWVQATTTQPVSLNTPNTFQLTFASSTTLGGAAGPATKNNVAITVPTPARYVRAVFSIPIGALNGAVYAAIVPSKEQPE